MTFLLIRDELWDLKNGDERIPRILAIRVQEDLEEGGIGANSTINNVTNWKKSLDSRVCIRLKCKIAYNRKI